AVSFLKNRLIHLQDRPHVRRSKCLSPPVGRFSMSPTLWTRSRTVFRAAVKHSGLLAAVGLLLGLPGLAAAQYKFTTIDAPGSTRTAVNGNSPNAIAGEFDDIDGVTHGFVATKNGLTQIDVPGADWTSVNGVNAEGQLAGIFFAGRLYGYV